MVADAHFAGGRLTHHHLHHLHGFRTAMLVDTNGAGQAVGHG